MPGARTCDTEYSTVMTTIRRRREEKKGLLFGAAKRAQKFRALGSDIASQSHSKAQGTRRWKERRKEKKNSHSCLGLILKGHKSCDLWCFLFFFFLRPELLLVYTALEAKDGGG